MMLSCEKVIEGLWEYLDREMDSNGTVIIERHLELCRRCFSRIEFERLLREHLKTRTDHLCPEKLKKRIQGLIELY